MKSWFRKGALVGSVLGAAAGFFATSKMDSRQKRRIMRNTRRTFSNIKDGVTSLDRKSVV